MRLIYNREMHEHLLEIVSDYEGHNASTDLMLDVGDVELSDRLEDGDWQVSKDSPAWTLAPNVSGVLPSQLQNAPVKLRVNIAGIFLDVFDGLATDPEPHDDYSSSLLAGTPGTLLDKIPLGAPVEYKDKTPEWVIRDALHRIRQYDRGKITIPNFERPVINKLLREGDGFEDNQHPRDILDSVSEILGCSYYDKPIGNGHKCYRDVGTGEGETITWSYDADDDKQVYAWSNPSPALPEQQYTSVVVRERRDDGTLAFWEEVPVFYTNLKYPPPQGQILFVDFDTATDPEGDPLYNLARADAHRRAVKEARTLSRMIHYGSFDVAFNPFLEPVDVLTLESTREDDTGFYRTIFRAVIEDLMHPFSASSIYTTIGYRAAIVKEVRLPDPPIVLPGITPHVVSFAGLRFAVAETDEDVVIDDTVEWAIDFGEDVLFTDDAPVTEGAEDVEINR